MLLLEFCIDLQQMITWPLCHGELEDNCTISLDILCKLKKTKLPTIKMGGEKSIFTMSRMWFLSILNPNITYNTRYNQLRGEIYIHRLWNPYYFRC